MCFSVRFFGIRKMTLHLLGGLFKVMSTELKISLCSFNMDVRFRLIFKNVILHQTGKIAQVYFKTTF